MIDNLVFELLDRRVVAGEASHLAVRAGEKTVDVASLVESSGSYGGALRQLGAEPGRSVTVGPVDSFEALVAVLGVLRIGAVADLAGDADIDTTDLDYGVAIAAGRTNPAGTARVAEDAPAVVLPDGRVVTAQTLAAAVADEERTDGPYGTVLDALRALGRGEFLVFPR